MIWRAELDSDEGGWLLVIDGEEFSGTDRVAERIDPDAIEDLDRSLQPWREWKAEGEAVRQEYEAHRASGKCGHWIGGVGPCELDHGHDGGHTVTVTAGEPWNL